MQTVVQVSGTALRISASNFRAAANQSHRIRDLIVRYAELELGQVQQTAACNGLHDASSRMCRWLLQTSDKTDSDLIPFTHEFIAQMLGVRRAGVSVAAARFQKGGFIRYGRGQLTIVNRRGLENATCACYGVMRREFDRPLR